MVNCVIHHNCIKIIQIFFIFRSEYFLHGLIINLTSQVLQIVRLGGKNIKTSNNAIAVHCGHDLQVSEDS